MSLMVICSTLRPQRLVSSCRWPELYLRVSLYIVRASGICSFLFHGVAYHTIQNCDVPLIRKSDHITPLFQRIRYKINTPCYKCITGTAPSSLCDCLQLYTPSRTLRSASDTLSLQIPRTRLSTAGSRAFSVFGPSTWNDLPLPLRHKPSRDSFKSHLKNNNIKIPKLLTCHVFCSVLVSSSIPSLPGVFCPF